MKWKRRMKKKKEIEEKNEKKKEMEGKNKKEEVNGREE